ncbi:MAG: hypothetical protein PWP38_1830 [Clostridiales bacterium]|nr:hypothetical protein [Clostridiales bacterium]
MLHNQPPKNIYDSLFHKNPSVMLIINPVNGEIIDANEAACAFYQYSKETMQRMKITEINLLSEEDVKHEMALAIHEERSHFRFKHKLANGEMRWVEVYTNPLQIDGESFLYSIIQDVTERRKNELQIIELNQKLELLVAKRTRELEKINHQLTETNDALENRLFDEKRSQEILNQLYDEMSDLYNNAPCGYHSTNADGIVVRMNDAALKWLGYNRTEVVSKMHFTELLAPESRANYEVRYKQFVQTGEFSDLELVMQRKDGSSFPVIGSGTVVYDDDGRFILSRSTLFDISKRKDAENSLKKLNETLEETVLERTEHLESINAILEEEIEERSRIESHLNRQNDLLDTLINMINVGVMMIDIKTGYLQFINEPARDIMGITAHAQLAEIQFEGFLKALVNADGEPYAREDMPFAQAIEGNTSHVEDMMMRRSNGEDIYLEMFSAPVRDIHGNVSSVLLSLTDISERKAFEEHIQMLNVQLMQTNDMLEDSNAELEESNAMLEEEIAEKNRTQEALILAKEDAENANAAKSNFLANMSHEIRTPMNGIIGMTELALMTALDDEQKNYLLMVKKSANSLLRIINDVLDYTKIEVGRINIEHNAFSLNDIVDETVSLFSVNADQKHLNIQTMIAKEIPESLYGDSLRIKQVLGNLIGNAIKFTDHGHIHIKVKMEAQTNLFVKLKFIVEDTGIGIPEDKRSLLFERFSQIDSSYAKPFQGTGLGLAISKKLVELMGGDIWLSNSSDEGSTFCFTIQLGQDKGMIQQMNAIRNVIESIPEPMDMKTRILVVEDDEISRQAIVTFLKKQHYDILVAQNGIQAIEIARSNPVDIILMDIQMPELDGFSATREIRTNLKLSKVPIIAMTAYALSGDRERCLNAGMDDYVSKPINFEEIKSKIIKHIN